MSSTTYTKNNTHPVINKKGFQRLYLEYFAFLQDLNVEHITKLYHHGMKHNLEKANFNSDTLRYVKNEISKHVEQIKNNATKYKEGSQKNITDESLYLRQALCDYINYHYPTHIEHNVEDKNVDSKESSGNSGIANLSTLLTLEQLEQKLKLHVEANPTDLLSQLNLAWLYFHLVEDYEAASVHFTHAFDSSMLDDSPLGPLTLRYISMSYSLLGNTTKAVSSLQRATSLDLTNDYHHLYEMAQQTIKDHNNDGAISRLKALIKKSVLYYLHIQSDPFFTSIPEVDTLLSRFHSARLEAIKEATYNKWKQSKPMQQKLPDEFNPQEVFSSTYDEHLTLLAHQPYPVLCRTEMISNKLFTKLEGKAQITLDKMNKQFSQNIQSEQKKWKFINLAGVGLIYLAVLLTLASIFLFIGGDLLGLTARTGDINWGHLVPRIFASVLGMGVIGIGLLLYNSPKLKRLAKKKSMLVEAMD